MNHESQTNMCNAQDLFLHLQQLVPNDLIYCAGFSFQRQAGRQTTIASDAVIDLPRAESYLEFRVGWRRIVCAWALLWVPCRPPGRCQTLQRSDSKQWQLPI